MPPMTMTRSLRTTLVLGAMLAACSDSPTGPGPIARGVGAVINGTPWQAALHEGTRTTTGFVATGTDQAGVPVEGLEVWVESLAGPGTFEFSGPSEAAGVRLYMVDIEGVSSEWSSNGVGGSVRITVTELTDDHVAGTFSATLVPDEGPATGNRSVQSGTFHVDFEE